MEKPTRARSRKMETAKVDLEHHVQGIWRAGCPEPIRDPKRPAEKHRAAIEEETPTMNRSANGGRGRACLHRRRRSHSPTTIKVIAGGTICGGQLSRVGRSPADHLHCGGRMRTPSPCRRLDLSHRWPTGSSSESPPRLRPDASPQALRIPDAPDTLPPDSLNVMLQVHLGCFHLSTSARVGFSIHHLLWPARLPPLLDMPPLGRQQGLQPS